MEITASTEQAKVPVTVLHLAGDLDASTEGQLVEQARAVAAQGVDHVIIDLAQVRFLSSAGVRALHRVYLLLRPEGEQKTMLEGVRDGTYSSANLKLLQPNHNVKSVLSLPGIDMYLQVYPDLASALGSF